ncbi:unnamed protein product [Rotaria sp. Silwood2]|nr:unnamed protein product [Rotaria sp. Silwood2]CAF4485366.1 unnamed protein product [Rotaria sp. Silwood2]
MEHTTIRVERPDPQDGSGIPNHLIIWLDKFIGKANEYYLLKRAFFMTTDPTTGYVQDLKQEDIDHSIRLNEAISVRLDGIQFMLRAFDTVDNCFEAIENNFDKRLFIITSGSKGRILLPALTTHFQEKIKQNYPVYIFCGNMNMVQVGDVVPTNEWVWDFQDYALMFNHENDLLARMVLNIIDYFYTEGNQLRQAEKLESASQHYRWAKIMLQRRVTMSPKVALDDREKELNHLIDSIDQHLSQRNNDKKDRAGEPCA